MTEYSVLEGQNLILSIGGVALGYSSGCKVSTTVETGERKTKESASGKWNEKYVKSFSESISADGVVLENGSDQMPTYDELKAAMLAGEPVEAQYSTRDGSTRTGKKAGGYKGKYLITSLDLDAQAGDDSKYSVKLDNVGAVEKVEGGNGLNTTADA
jgi:predicted secreted protein